MFISVILHKFLAWGSPVWYNTPKRESGTTYFGRWVYRCFYVTVTIDKYLLQWYYLFVKNKCSVFVEQSRCRTFCFIKDFISLACKYNHPDK